MNYILKPGPMTRPIMECCKKGKVARSLITVGFIYWVRPLSGFEKMQYLMCGELRVTRIESSKIQMRTVSLLQAVKL